VTKIAGIVAKAPDDAEARARCEERGWVPTAAARRTSHALEEAVMDDTTDRERKTRIPGSDVGEQVGLGRVIEDRRHATGSPDAGDPRRRGDEVEEASEESFPASDPPTYMSDSATPSRRDHPSGDAEERPAEEPIEPPAPDDVP
jgi:hypothetical protein